MLTSQGYTGVDVCDLAECSCKDLPAAACLATPATGSHSGAVDRCTRDFCRLGCICDSLRTKEMPPSHCMFGCSKPRTPR